MIPLILRNFKKLALAAVVIGSISTAKAQTTVTTAPVGFTNITCSGSSDTIVSLPLARPTEYVGQIASVSGSILTIAGSPSWTASQWVYAQGSQPKTYYVEIGGVVTAIAGTVSTTGVDNVVTGVGTTFTTAVAVGNGLIINGSYFVVASIVSDTSLTTTVPSRVAASAATASVSVSPNEGRIYTVTANDASSLTIALNGDSISSIQANTSISIIPYWTLNSVFPAGDANTSYIPTISPLSRQTQILIPDYVSSGINLSAPILYIYYNYILHHNIYLFL